MLINYENDIRNTKGRHKMIHWTSVIIIASMSAIGGFMVAAILSMGRDNHES